MLSRSKIVNQYSCKYCRYPSYVQDIMGDIFSLGFGPFRWVCTSGDPTDLETTDTVYLYILLAWEPSVAQGSHS